jgi:dihydrofolate reductase
MGRVTCNMSISLDGFVAGPGQSLETPLGEGGECLHEWMFATGTWRGDADAPRTVDDDEMERIVAGNGAFIMGRNMFGPIRGQWTGDWRGWWGEEPPYRAPVFVLTHHPREPLEMKGGTTFHFVTDGIEAALERARAAAGDLDVAIAGGAQTARQYLRAGLIDELTLHISPVVLGAGERLLEDVGDLRLEPISATHSPRTTHVRYRVLR